MSAIVEIRDLTKHFGPLRVLDLIERARAAHGMAVVTVSHNPMVAERADQRLTMRDGLIGDD